MVWSVLKKSASPCSAALAAPPLPQTPSPFLSSGLAIQRPPLKSASRHPGPPRDRPRAPKSGPRAGQERPGATKERPRAAQQRPRPPQDRPQTRLKAILKPYYIFRVCWTRKSSETFIFKWFGAFFKNPPLKSASRHPGPPQDRPRAPKSGPRDPQERPKRAQDRPKIAPKRVLKLS